MPRSVWGALVGLLAYGAWRRRGRRAERDVWVGLVSDPDLR